MGVFVKGTEPVFAVVRAVTGGRLGDRAVALLSLGLLLALRIALVPALRG
jgi:multisubunit Na+/H+ antiporter MnhF subunit